MSEITLVEPFPAWAWPLAWEWLVSSWNQVAHDFTPTNVGAFVEYSRRRYQRTFGVCRDGQIGEVVLFEQATPALAIAHLLFSRSFIRRQRGGAAEGFSLACERLFATSKTVKISGLVLEHNRLAVALLRRLGFRQEGVLRHHTLRNGDPLNVVALGLTREECDEYRRGLRRLEQHELRAGDQQHHQQQDVRGAGADEPAASPGAILPVPGPGDDQRDPEPQRAGDGNAIGGPDQPDGEGNQRSGNELSGEPRDGIERSKRERRAPNRTRQRKPARS